MSEGTLQKFSCDACGRTYSWKSDLAGKRVKCKCGEAMTVPAPKAAVAKRAPDAEPELDDLYALAPQAGVDESQPYAQLTAPVAVVAVGRGPVSPVLGYVPGRNAAQREKAVRDAGALIDPKRDLYVPVALLLFGLLLYAMRYVAPYGLGAGAMAKIVTGIAILTAVKATILFGFALILAGPLGVSFGGIGTAFLKLAAIAVFADGITAWIDFGVAKSMGVSSAVGGFSGYSAISLPVAAGIYWGLMIYLFSMDSGDSWLVVVILSFFDYVIRTALLVLFLNFIMGGFGGGGGSSSPAGGGGSSVTSGAMSEQTQHIEELKETNRLTPAKEYIEGGRKADFAQVVRDLLNNGCPNVWFEVTRDINGKGDATDLIIELPAKKSLRKDCIVILKEWFKVRKWDPESEDLQDDGDKYLVIPLGG